MVCYLGLPVVEVEFLILIRPSVKPYRLRNSDSAKTRGTTSTWDVRSEISYGSV